VTVLRVHLFAYVGPSQRLPLHPTSCHKSSASSDDHDVCSPFILIISNTSVHNLGYIRRCVAKSRLCPLRSPSGL
jgi:hypothetical protein